MVLTVSANAHELFDRIADYMSADDQARVKSAFAYAREKHEGQTRKSGEPYITHPATVAYYLADYQLDDAALIAALLHDVAEDTPASIPDIQAQFGQDVAQIVDGVTKFQQSTDTAAIHKLSDKEKHDQTVSKLFRFMTRDVRVIMIKLFDRLHNMRTLGSMPRHKQIRIAKETLDIYARLANRLGMWQVKNELERLSFQILEPETFLQIKKQLISRIGAHNQLVDQVCARITHRLEDKKVGVSKVCVSPRNVYTIYKKHEKDEKDEGAITVDNVPRILVVVKDKIACYTTLGIIHEMWGPVPGEFDDYIAQPRDNLYRALHTTVRHERGGLVKIRVRTDAMAVMSEIGVLGRWAEIGGDVTPEMEKEMGEQVDALFRSIELNFSAEDTETGTFVQNVLGDLFSDQITAHTPKGDPIELPLGATALDFAFKIHTQVGITAHRATINGVNSPLNTALRDGDTVTIKRRAQTPKRRWLDEELGYLHTGNARNVVRRSFRKLPETIAARQGRALLDNELKMIGHQFVAHDIIAAWFGQAATSDLYLELGRAELLASEVSRRVLAEVWHQGPAKNIARKVTSRSDQNESEMYVILGASDVSETLHLCGNCNPRPGAQIRGYIRKNKRITVHRLDCHLLPPDTDANKLLHLRWGQESSGAVREACIEIEVYDRPNLLYEITDMLRAEHVNISWINTPRENGTMRVDICLDVNSPFQLVGLLHRFKALVNVRNVRYIPRARSA